LQQYGSGASQYDWIMLADGQLKPEER
jgi:hypothetical protein